MIHYTRVKRDILDLFTIMFIWVGQIGSTVAEQCTRDSKVEGLNPAAIVSGEEESSEKQMKSRFSEGSFTRPISDANFALS